jgi:hypothetical protein
VAFALQQQHRAAAPLAGRNLEAQLACLARGTRPLEHDQRMQQPL